MLTLLYEGLKRLVFGPTSVFAVRSGSSTFRGSSFVTVYSERVDYPIKIVGIKFATQGDALGEWRISVAGIGKIFPYSETNPLDNDYHSLVPIEIAAGERFCIEVRSRNAQQKSVVILEELNIVEMR